MKKFLLVVTFLVGQTGTLAFACDDTASIASIKAEVGGLLKGSNFLFSKMDAASGAPTFLISFEAAGKHWLGAYNVDEKTCQATMVEVGVVNNF